MRRYDMVDQLTWIRSCPFIFICEINVYSWNGRTKIASIYKKDGRKNPDRKRSLRLTRVFPVPLAPAIEVISPYLNPPLKAPSSNAAEPELAGVGLVFPWALAAARRLDPNRGGAGKAVTDMI